ncbi:hypothetical protein SB461_26795 [Burkholderia cenocepacia]|uniref:hypothetical protein n=1 Tax=Burkholderia cenocepacia TaxID=95486 RepID=UPI002B23F296|nr:hypothetical protein [Burkholderia cenocepacia]MEB2610107.1 hypothetical protein [Burkholderia cenocepacia]
MKLEIDGKPTIENVREPQVVRAIKVLKSYGPASYASITDADGNYVQVAGGGASCMVEHYVVKDSKRTRAYHDNPSPIRPDGTILSFRAGNIPMRSDEWFMASQVIEIFLSFVNGTKFPTYCHWRDSPGF